MPTPPRDLLDTARTAHRPWPVPPRRWTMAMGWHDLAFLHWPVPVEKLAVTLPAGLELDTFDGEAWLGVVPFRMSGVRPRGLPGVPGLSAFPEINLRTYVTAEGKPGVWFYSLDVTKRLAVWAARTFFHLPYYFAGLRAFGRGTREEPIDYAHRRPQGPGFVARYHASGPVELTRPGTLEAWLTERYCLYSADRRGRVFRGDVQHVPWPLQPAEVEIVTNSLADPIGIELSGPPPLAHFAADLDVLAWGLEPVAWHGVSP